MMLSTKCNHTFWIMMIILVPRWVKMVPLKIWPPTIRDRATEAYFFT